MEQRPLSTQIVSANRSYALNVMRQNLILSLKNQRGPSVKEKSKMEGLKQRQNTSATATAKAQAIVPQETTEPSVGLTAVAEMNTRPPSVLHAKTVPKLVQRTLLSYRPSLTVQDQPNVKLAASRQTAKERWREKILAETTVPPDCPSMVEYKKATGFVLSTEEQLQHQILLARWNSRPPSLKAATTPEYQREKLKKLELLCIADLVDREEEFDRRVNWLDWDYSTASAYWSQMVKLAEDVGVPVDHSMRVKGRVLNSLARENLPGRPTTPLLVQQLHSVLPLLPLDLRLAVAVSFLLGQRMGDTLKLERGCLDTVTDISSGTTFLCLQYRRGKTTRRKQPFTLHLPRQYGIAQELLDLQQSGHPGTPLFLDSEKGDPERALNTIRTALHTVDGGLSVLSIRRGGLQHMAQLGASTETLLHHSRHSKQELLERYLSYGKLLLSAARERFVGTLSVQTQEKLQELTAEMLMAVDRSLMMQREVG